MGWTKEQQAAIDARGSNLLVSAAAGSGKTAVLVERILQLIIKDGVNIDRMLIVTFTNAAAGEMRERIGTALMGAMENGDGPNDHLREQINLLPKSSISTIHSFCISIIRKYFYAINLDPGFRIGDETECSIMKQEALEELMEKKYEEAGSEFLGLVDRFGDNKKDTPVFSLITRLHSFIQSKPNPEEWLSQCVESFTITVDNIESAPWYEALIKYIDLEVSGAINLLKEALPLCQKPLGPKAYEENINDDICQLEKLLTILYCKGLNECCNQYESVKFSILKRCARDVDEDLKDEVKALRDEAKGIIASLGNDVLGVGFETSVGQLNELYPYMTCLYELVVALDDEYKAKKQERGIIDFNDLEHYALTILGNEEIAQEVGEKYDYIFIDEYQDSNIIQETILNRVCKKNNMFMVGDVKQSIYRFRLADPSIFMGKYDRFDSTEGAMNRRIDLNKNFRSRPEILDGVNFIFRNIMSKDFGEMDYDEKVALYQGGKFEPIENPEIEVHLIEKSKDIKDIEDKDVNNLKSNYPSDFDNYANSNNYDLDNSLETDIEFENLSDIEIEAMVAANKIKELLNTTIYDPKKDSYRNITYKDIVILLRTTKGYASVYQEIFASQGIPVYADFNTGYFEAIEVKTIVNLLKVIDNKYQDIPLLSVLRSPIGGFNAQDLIKVRTNSKSKMFHDSVTDYIKNFEDELSQRLQSFYNKIENWQEVSRYLPMEEFLWKLYMESGYYYYVGVMPGGKQRQANLKVLLDRASKFQETSIKGLFQFIRFIDKIRSGSGDMGVAKTLSESDNVVRIMSIHKSKGLEFPVVIVGGLGKQFNLKDTSRSILFHKDLGIGPRYVNPETRQTCDTISKVIMKQVIKLESLAEEMRILYVAFTRPKDKLILLGSVKDLDKAEKRWSKKISPYSLSKGKTFFDWICPVLMNHKNTDNDNSKWSIHIHNANKLSSITDSMSSFEKELLDLLDNPEAYTGDEYLELIDERFSWEYKYKYAINIPSKMSVTELKQLNNDSTSPYETSLTQADLMQNSSTFLLNEPTLIERPRFMEGTKRFTAAEIGTVVHFVLQHLDLKRVETREMIETQLNEMVQKELLTKEDIEVVNIDTVLSFYRSDIGQRILNTPNVYREVPFNYRKDASEVIEGLNVKGETLLIQGVIDCYFEEEDGLVLVDYKTDYVWDKGYISPKDGMPQGVKTIVDRYRIQIDLYAEALEKVTGKPVKEKILYLLSANLPVSI